MKLTIIFMFISLNCFSQRIKFHEIPKPVRGHVDSLRFKNAEPIGDSFFQINYRGIKQKEFYRYDGLKISNYEYTGGGGTVIGWTAFGFIASLLTGMFLGL